MPNYVDDLDDELDELHVTLTAEMVAGTMPLPVAIELAMVARFYERFGDHAVNLARRMAALVDRRPRAGDLGRRLSQAAGSEAERAGGPRRSGRR